MSDSPSFVKVFAELNGPEGLSAASARQVFDQIFAGAWTPAQIGGLLVALHMRGETAEVISAAARAMRASMLRVEHDLPIVLDTCGTGGDGRGTVNLSTGAAIIAAAAGVPVAKHGNRAASSQTGTADVLGALGVAMDVPPSAAGEILRRANIAFLFAPAHHPAMKHAMGPRRELGIRTLFNILGPLANPAGATHQLLGVFADRLRPTLAAALRELGSVAAWVVHSTDGLDELSPYAPTKVSVLSGGRVEERVIAPEDFGLSPSQPGAIDGGDAGFNAAIVSKVLAGEAHPARTAFVLNAAAALVVARELSPRDAAQLAQQTLRSGAAIRTLEAWQLAARQARPAAV
jgi:anthranilate phosphoribosyltransferase